MQWMFITTWSHFLAMYADVHSIAWFALQLTSLAVLVLPISCFVLFMCYIISYIHLFPVVYAYDVSHMHTIMHDLCARYYYFMYHITSIPLR